MATGSKARAPALDEMATLRRVAPAERSSGTINRSGASLRFNNAGQAEPSEVLSTFCLPRKVAGADVWWRPANVPECEKGATS